MSILDWVVGIIIVGCILVWTISGLYELIPFVTRDAYRHLRYTRKGVCYKCKRPFQGYVEQQVDQMYAGRVLHPVCDCKDTHYLPMGNRHAAEW